jgi:mono/diheme cytochrome c family protein
VRPMRPPRLAIACLVLLGASGCSFFFGPSTRPPSTATVESTPERVARGEYLAWHVAVCVDCHSPRVRDRFSMPPKKGFELAGGDCYGEELGVPGTICMSNITPDKDYGVGQWTDGELIRAIREGVSRDGRALVPFMPYPSYRFMSDEDVNAIVAYLRTVKPVSQKTPPNDFGFFVRHAFNMFPKPVEGPVQAPARTQSVEYGGYLVKMAGCHDCHTPRGATDFKEDEAYSGGVEFKLPGVMNVRAANITPDPETGIGRMTREQFISRFKSFADREAVTADPISPARQTMMPWPLYAGMTEEDLGAIYDYLRTVKPLQKKVVHFVDADPTQANTKSEDTN